LELSKKSRKTGGTEGEDIAHADAEEDF